MFESILSKDARCSGKICWTAAMPGVRVCDFDAVFTAVQQPQLLPDHYETIFCQGGTLYIHMLSGCTHCIQKGDILLLSDVSQIEAVSFPKGRFEGVAVAVNAPKARGSFVQICSLLGQKQLDVRQAGRLMHSSGGCVCIHRSVWSEALFVALAGLPAGERASYCALKAVELLYLLCGGGFDLPQTVSARCDGCGQTELARQVRDYIQAHLAENLSIDRLARQFHCSPTALKAAFRQSYGTPVHRCITAYRLRRGAELLTATTFSILQVAAEVGYSSASQFSAMFKRQYHLSPAQYRRRRKKSETDDFSA